MKLYEHLEVESERFFPQAGMEPTRGAGDEEPEVFLPLSLRNLTSPTQSQKIAVLRLLAFRIARTLDLLNLDLNVSWFGEDDAEFDDLMEIATVILGALRAQVVSTGDGSIELRVDPWADELDDFLLRFYVPFFHLGNTSADDDELDLEFAVEDGRDLADVYTFDFLEDYSLIVNLDTIGDMSADDYAVVAVRRHGGLSAIRPVRDFGAPEDRVKRVLMGVIHFFKSSGEGVEPTEQWTLEDATRDMHEYNEEFPGEEDIAEEKFRERMHGEMTTLDFLEAGVVHRVLGFGAFRAADSEGGFTVTVAPPPDLCAVFEGDNIGETSEDVLMTCSIVGPVTLGIYEHLLFSPGSYEGD